MTAPIQTTPLGSPESGLQLAARSAAQPWESKPSSLVLDDLDHELLERARHAAGLAASTNEDYLLERRLADRRERRLVLRRGAELLFARAPGLTHATIQTFVVRGTERRDDNVEARARIGGPLCTLVRRAFDAVAALLRDSLRGSTRVQSGAYPVFAWREVLLNAVAHRDYGDRTRSTEVWSFEDRLEILGPGGLLPQIQVDALRSRRYVHESRNPSIVRVLTDLGFMRDQGHGIPWLFAEMERFHAEPKLESTEEFFRVTLPRRVAGTCRASPSRSTSP